MMFSSCDYDYIHPAPIILPTDSISFKSDIVPIFSNRGCLGCHGAGLVYPDLTAADAYQSLMSDPDIIKKQDPAASVLYLKITTGTMKDKGTSPTEVAIILQWIKEGAHNN